MGLPKLHNSRLRSRADHGLYASNPNLPGKFANRKSGAYMGGSCLRVVCAVCPIFRRAKGGIPFSALCV